MSEPTEEELARAERIRKLRSGGARSRGHEMRERRRERSVDRPTADAEASSDDSAAEAASDDADADGSGGESDPAPDAGQADVLELAASLPDDGSLFVVPATEGLRRQFNTVAEQLHLRYGFEYGSDLDAERHVRPLALYLGVRALEDADAEAVRKLLESVDDLEAPDDE